MTDEHCIKKTLFQQELKVINIGLLNFAENLRIKNIPVVHIKWTPPAMGDQSLLDLLEKLNSQGLGTRILRNSGR